MGPHGLSGILLRLKKLGGPPSTARFNWLKTEDCDSDIILRDCYCTRLMNLSRIFSKISPSSHVPEQSPTEIPGHQACQRPSSCSSRIKDLFMRILKD